jgi:hypothetical protein
VTGIVGLAASIVLYAYDEDPDHADTTSKTYRDTAPLAVGVGAVSVIALGIGIWQWTKGRPSSSAAKVAPRRDGATVAFELTF